MEMTKNLRRLLAEKGLTVSQLSVLSEVPAKTIYHWTSGQKPRNIEQLLKVCKVLETTIEALFGFEISPRPTMTYISLGELSSDMHLGTFEVVLRPLKK